MLMEKERSLIVEYGKKMVEDHFHLAKYSYVIIHKEII